LTVDDPMLRSILATAPLEFTPAAANPLELALPMPDGSFDRFAVVESPIMEPGLAAQFPDIKTFRGQGLDDPTATVRFDVTPAGFRAQVLSPEGSWYIDPFYHLDTSLYLSYSRDAMGEAPEWQCHGALDPLNPSPLFAAPVDLAESRGAGDTQDLETHQGCNCGLCQTAAVAGSASGVVTAAARPDGGKMGAEPLRSGTVLRTYRAAVAATGEYTAFHGGTVALGQAAIVTAMNRINGIYESELAIRMVLVANNSSLVFTNAATDPYTNNDGGAMLGQNQTTVDSIIGNANYDIGHVFSTGGGGVAFLRSVGVDNIKAGGVTGQSAPIGDPFTVDYVAHEIGHQFGGNHTFNTSASSQRRAATAYEPGSGSTIMAYAGITPPDNLQPNSDPYFHFISLEEILAHVDVNIPNVGTRTATGNIVPTVSAGPSTYVIPTGTPFELTASGSDANGDTVTYSWEQRDLGAAQNLTSADNGASPLFRVWNPTTNPTRTFPRLSNLVNNTLPVGEKLPSVARAQMKFRVTARDNRSGGGGINWADNFVQVVNTGAPFVVTSPNTAVSWAGLSSQSVTWNVAGTTAAPISTANVNIRLSTDGGFTYPTLLASNVPNDGTETINVPNISTTQARIRVEGAGNIFFDISNANFSITPTVVAPVVSNVASPLPAGLHGIGAVIPITIAFSSPVTVTGTPLLALNSGGTATFASGSGTSTLTFNYVVAAGHSSTDLDYTSTSALTLNGGSILAGAVPATLTLPAPGAAGSLGANEALTIDGIAPTVLEYRVLFGSRSYNVLSGNRVLPWQITGIQVVLSEPAGTANIGSLTGLSNLSFGGQGTSTLTWGTSTLINGVFGTSVLGIGANAVRDAAGNALGNAVNFNLTLQVLYGDFNGDGVVNAADMTGAFNAIGTSIIFGDMNGDGVVDSADAQIVRRRIGSRLITP
jgi:hypothetical protein